MFKLNISAPPTYEIYERPPAEAFRPPLMSPTRADEEASDFKYYNNNQSFHPPPGRVHSGASHAAPTAYQDCIQIFMNINLNLNLKI